MVGFDPEDEADVFFWSPIMTREYYYGWRPSPPDFRDYLFSAPIQIVTALPPKVDLSGAWGTPWEPVWNQGRIGSCGPHTAAADIVFAALRQEQVVIEMPSRLFIYYITRLVMNTLRSDSGVSNRDMLKALARYGWVEERFHPYSDTNRGQPDDPFRRVPSPEVFRRAAERRISQYLAIPQQLEQMKGCLAGGDPFIFGFSVYSSLESEQVVKTGVVPLPTRADSMRGGHDVLMVGYDDATRLFKFRNSWGTGWGVGGYGFIPYEYATNPQLAGDFWTIKHSAIPSPTPLPKPEPKPEPVPVPIPKPDGGDKMNFLMTMLLNMLKVQLEKWLQDGTLQKLLEDLVKRLLENNPKTVADLQTQVEASLKAVNPTV